MLTRLRMGRWSRHLGFGADLKVNATCTDVADDAGWPAATVYGSW